MTSEDAKERATEPAGGSARIVGLQRSAGGVPKRSVESARVTPFGMFGDKQRDLKHHGGPDRALCIYSIECIERLNAEGHPIRPGTAGENVTIRGLDWPAVQPGKRYRLGDEALIEITAYTTPCLNIADSFVDGAFIRINHRQHPDESRVYARVLQEGDLHVGDAVRELHDDEEV